MKKNARYPSLHAALLSLGLAVVPVLAIGLALPAVAEAKPAPAKTHARAKKRRAKRLPLLTGFQVPPAMLRSEPLPRPSGHLELTAANFRGEALSVDIYNADGSFNEAALDKLYHLWRCKRTGTEKPVDPHLFEILSLIYDHFQKPIELVSGFRNQERTSSFHFHASASDIRIPGIDEKTLHDFATTLDTGGMGIGRYPRAHFIHVDVRPEPSYRWTDRSAPSNNMGHPHKRKRPHNA